LGSWALFQTGGLGAWRELQHDLPRAGGRRWGRTCGRDPRSRRRAWARRCRQKARTRPGVRPCSSSASYKAPSRAPPPTDANPSVTETAHIGVTFSRIGPHVVRRGVDDPTQRHGLCADDRPDRSAYGASEQHLILRL